MLDYKINTFLSLCRNMNYRVTAEELNLSQPAITNHIQQLESYYNCKLFIYKNRILYKTKEAEILENYSISAEYNSSKLINEISIKEKQKLRIGATRTIGEYIINNQISKLILEKDIDLIYTIDNTDNLILKIKNGELDYIFIEGYFNKDEFCNYTYKKESLVGICSKEHPFANKTIELKDIFSNRLIYRENGSGTKEAFDRILTNNNYTIDSFQNKIQINSFSSITQLVADNIGISFVYESVANKNNTLRKFYIKGIESSHEFTCAHLKNSIKPLYLEYFIDKKLL